MVGNGEFIFGVLVQIAGQYPSEVVALRHGGAVGRAEVDDSDEVWFSRFEFFRELRSEFVNFLELSEGRGC